MTTVRGAIYDFLKGHQDKIRGDVLEVGSRICHSAPECDFRKLGRHNDTWTGIDMEAGAGVDVVADFVTLQSPKKYDTVIACEVLEHVPDPIKALNKLFRLLKDGGNLFITVPFCFHYHAYPDDYFRISPSAIRHYASEAGLNCEASFGGMTVELVLQNSPQEGRVVKRQQTHTFAHLWK